MDHVMEKITNYYEIYLQDFAEDCIKHEYKNYSDNPLIVELKLLARSINLYRDYLKLPRINLRLEIMHEIERRK